SPQPGVVDLDAAERPAVAARHLPRDLWAGPRLRDDTARVVHLALRDLARLALPDLHGPARRLPVEGLLVHAIAHRITRQPIRDLRKAKERRVQVLFGQMRGADRRC